MKRFLLVLLCLFGLCLTAQAQGYKTRNFQTYAPTPELAKEFGDAAEYYRKELAIQWLGVELPPWEKPCPIQAKLAKGNGGATSFNFINGTACRFVMEIQGSRERLLDSVIPHEVTHTIFATHFREPLPRWADEGACTTVEHTSEIQRMEKNLIQFLKTGRGIPFDKMLAMTEYPQDVLPLYAQGYSVSRWLIKQRGRKHFMDFILDGLSDNDWRRAVEKYYGYRTTAEMQNAWLQDVKRGV